MTDPTLSPRRVRVLAIDDQAFDAELLGRFLGRLREFEVDFVHHADVAAAFDYLTAGPVDFIFVDFYLGADTGREVLRTIRSTGDIRPVIVVTGHGDEHVAADIMRAGADDYLIKGEINPRVLYRSMLHAEAQYLRRKAERELRETNLLLASLLEREKHTSRKLEQAMEVAEAATRAKSEFLANVSHELRTPLNSIIGFTEMMIDDTRDPPNPRRARRLEKVQRNSHDLLALINEILDLSKIEAGQLTVEHADVDVVALLNERAESIAPLIGDKKVEFRLRIDDGLREDPTWRGDGFRLGQVVTNLLSNAAKFTDAGFIELRARVDGDALLIEVRDTGTGISPEEHELIFKEFQQAESSRKRRAGGTGLGLAISRKLCQLMGGTVDVRSIPAAGSVFVVRLPRAIPHRPAAPPLRVQEAPRS